MSSALTGGIFYECDICGSVHGRAGLDRCIQQKSTNDIVTKLDELNNNIKSYKQQIDELNQEIILLTKRIEKINKDRKDRKHRKDRKTKSKDPSDVSNLYSQRK
jgi:predicted RNase H-like nuclease (RuvC/YqgF family)